MLLLLTIASSKRQIPETLITIHIFLQGIHLNDLVDKTKFLYDQHEVVLQAIRRLQPGFEPHYTPPVLNYECSLLNNLNEPQNRLGLKNCPAEGLLSVEEILKEAQEQLEIEIKGDIEIKNIDSRDELTESVKFCVSITLDHNPWNYFQY